MLADYQPHREPLRTTLLRTGLIALAIGAIIAFTSGKPGGLSQSLSRWPAATLLALWPSFGGHWVEVGYLNFLRPRLPAARAVQIAARLAVWFIGGIGLIFGMRLTTMSLAHLQSMPWPAHIPAGQLAIVGGLGFVAIELVVHLVLQLRGCGSFYNGRG